MAWFTQAKGAHTFYHVSPSENRQQILAEGLIPRIGENSQYIGEAIPRVYLFPDYDSTNDALGQWLGDMYDPDVPLDVFAVDLPDTFWSNLDEQTVEYEVTTTAAIPAKCLRYVETQ